MADAGTFSQITDEIDSVTDAQAQAEEKEYEREYSKLHLLEMQQDLEARKKYAKDVFKLVVGWLLAVLVVVLCDGLTLESESWPLGFDLSDKVMMTLSSVFSPSSCGICSRPVVLNGRRRGMLDR